MRKLINAIFVVLLASESAALGQTPAPAAAPEAAGQVKSETSELRNQIQQLKKTGNYVSRSRD